MTIICGLLRFLSYNFNFLMTLFLIGLVFVLFIQCIIIYKQPQYDHISFYKVPCVPFLPFASFIVNLYLMMMISLTEWFILLIWMIIGFVIYFTYGVKMSKENCKLNKTSTEKSLLNQNSISSI